VVVASKTCPRPPNLNTGPIWARLAIPNAVKLLCWSLVVYVYIDKAVVGLLTSLVAAFGRAGRRKARGPVGIFDMTSPSAWCREIWAREATRAPLVRTLCPSFEHGPGCLPQHEVPQ